MKAAVILFLFLLPLTGEAYILPTRTILQKTSANAGSGIYAIEQEVQFQNGQDSLSLKETWLIDSDRTLRLTVTGTKDYKDSIKLQFLYTGGKRHRLVDGQARSENISAEFLERFFNFRSPENFANLLMHHKILPPGAYERKDFGRVSNDFKYTPEKWVRLSRTGGVINFAFGTPTPPEQNTSEPGLWIEQDQFLIRKLRLPTQVEVTADNYNTFAKNLHYPKVRTIRWDDNTVTIRLISAATRPASANKLFHTSSMDVSQKVDGLAGLPAKDAILQFYSRFR